jgi:hypothetical protein
MLRESYHDGRLMDNPPTTIENLFWWRCSQTSLPSFDPSLMRPSPPMSVYHVMLVLFCFVSHTMFVHGLLAGLDVIANVPAYFLCHVALRCFGVSFVWLLWYFGCCLVQSTASGAVFYVWCWGAQLIDEKVSLWILSTWPLLNCFQLHIVYVIVHLYVSAGIDNIQTPTRRDIARTQKFMVFYK